MRREDGVRFYSSTKVRKNYFNMVPILSNALYHIYLEECSEGSPHRINLEEPEVTQPNQDEPGGTVGYPAQPELIHSSVSHSVCLSVRAKSGIWSKRVFMRTKGNFSFACVEGIIQLFTNFYL